MYLGVLFLHILAATIWTGGHIVLATTVLPRALKAADPRILLDFESGFEKVGMPALLVQVVSGIWMAHERVPQWSLWLSPSDATTALITAKLALLATTIALALDARLRIIPSLSPQTLPAMARRVRAVTVLSMVFVAVGVSFRGGLLV